MVRVIAYIRVSTDRQAIDGTSLITQRRRVIEYVTAKGYDLARLFVEGGESAKTEHRPVLQEMLAFCQREKGRIDALIFPKIDRFARYTEDYHHLKRTLRECGVRIESIDERFDDSPAGRFLESMLAATAQFDNDVRSERTYNGMKEAVTQGRWVFRAPFGFRNIRSQGKATMEPDPENVPLVTAIFERFARGTWTVAEIGEWTRAQGVSIGTTSLYRMIRNKAYIGIIEAFGVEVRGEPPMIPIISESLFYAAQNGLRRVQMPETIRRENPHFPLRGTVRCLCGKALTAAWSHGRSAKYAYYRCRRCSRINLRREAVETAFARFLSAIRAELPLDEAAVASLYRQADADRALLVEQRKRFEQELDRLGRLQKALILKTVEGVIPDEMAAQQLREFESAMRELRTKLAEPNASNAEPAIEKVVEFSRMFLNKVDEIWLCASLEVKQHIQRVLFPAGATLSFKGNARTAKGPALTGLRDVSFAGSFRLVDQSKSSANALCIVEPPFMTDQSEALNLCRRVYDAFGQAEADSDRRNTTS